MSLVKNHCVPNMTLKGRGVICRGKTNFSDNLCGREDPCKFPCPLVCIGTWKLAGVTAEGDNRPGSRFKYSFRLSDSTVISIFYTISDMIFKNKLL